MTCSRGSSVPRPALAAAPAAALAPLAAPAAAPPPTPAAAAPPTPAAAAPAAASLSPGSGLTYSLSSLPSSQAIRSARSRKGMFWIRLASPRPESSSFSRAAEALTSVMGDSRWRKMKNTERRSTGFSLDTKRVGDVMGTDTRAGCVNCRCVALESVASGAEGEADSVGIGGRPAEMAWRRRRRGSCSEEAILGGRFEGRSRGCGMEGMEDGRKRDAAATAANGSKRGYRPRGPLRLARYMKMCERRWWRGRWCRKRDRKSVV